MAPPPLPPLPSGGGSGGGSKRKPPQTPAQSAAASQARARAKEQLAQKQGVPSTPGNPYATINKRGNLVAVSNSKQALHLFGEPLKMSQAQTLYRQFNDMWINYLGRSITAKEFQRFATAGWSQYQIINNYLVNRPNFTKSPVWKNKYNDYADVWHKIYGEDAQPNQAAVKYAIVNNLNTGAFADYLRSKPDYLSSQEFKGNFSAMSAAYTQIYGLPTPQADDRIKRATLGGWDTTQFQSWLRQQPEWKSSDEAKGLYMNLADRFGLIQQQGGQTVLAGTAPAPLSPPSGSPQAPAASP